MRIRSAIPDDAQEILNMIIELADYEKSAHEVTATAEDVHKSFFTAKPSVYCEIVEDLGDNDNTVIVGLAVWFLIGSFGHVIRRTFLNTRHDG